MDLAVSFSVSPSFVLDLLHAILIGGIVAVRYLWPVWLLILALWLLTRILKGVFGFFGFSTPRRAPKPVSRPRR